MNCPLCKTKGIYFYKKSFFICKTCFGIFKDKNLYLTNDEEFKRYKLHNNNVDDLNYQNFLSPITTYVLNNFETNKLGLDFGSGKESAISHVLKNKSFKINTYDPFFNDDKNVLKQKYDFIICSEVIEHFYNVEFEFKKLSLMLNTNGQLICMTLLYEPNINFKKWYYKEDPTHVFFYQNQTIEYISKTFNFRSFTIDNRLIVFKN